MFSIYSSDLTWGGVSNADEYKLTIFDGDEYGTSEFKFSDKTSTTSYKVSDIHSINTGHYKVWVDARNLDASGNPKEITRGIDGFDFVLIQEY